MKTFTVVGDVLVESATPAVLLAELARRAAAEELEREARLEVLA